jgi:hypothetical protein
MMDPDCNCPKTKCERHGKCDECRQFHGAKGKLPYCERPKSSIVGSIKRMIGLG